MTFSTRITKLLGIRYPIIQGAFGLPGVGTAKIAVPVSEAGALGMLTTIAYKDPVIFQADLQKAKSLTDKPLAVNYSILEKWGAGISFHEPYLKIALDEGIHIGFTSAHDGSPIGEILKQTGGIWVHKCVTLRHAASIALKGADAVVIVGREGTGFKSVEQHTTMINLTAGRRLLDIPIIAAGGIADGYGLAGALAMGAAGVYIGTAFMATVEFPLPDEAKQKIVCQEITDGRYFQKFYNMKHDGRYSTASGIITSIPTVREFIQSIMTDAQKSLEKIRQYSLDE